jgi:hypothetical protein
MSPIVGYIYDIYGSAAILDELLYVLLLTANVRMFWAVYITRALQVWTCVLYV